MHRTSRTIRSHKRPARYLAGGNKKTVLAAGLVVIMAIMWFRVLTGRKPNPAAASDPMLNAPQQKEPAVTVRFHPLPIIPGRNDRIDRDFFAASDWSGFAKNTRGTGTGTDPEVPVVTPDRTREVITKVAQKLKLEAVLWSENPQIFVNDQLLVVGGTIKLTEGTETYEFEVVRIEADSVFVRCRERELALNLAQSNDVSP